MKLDELKGKAHRLLVQAQTRGMLTLVEADRRRNAVDSATDFEAIDRQISDLLQDSGTTLPEAPTRSVSLVIPPRAASVFCLMAERRIRTPALGDQTTALTVMGSTVLDLSEAVIDKPVFLEILTVMAETRVLLPRGTPVDIRAVPVMGAVTEDRNLEIRQEGPRVVIQGAVIMGELKVTYS